MLLGEQEVYQKPNCSNIFHLELHIELSISFFVFDTLKSEGKPMYETPVNDVYLVKDL